MGRPGRVFFCLPATWLALAFCFVPMLLAQEEPAPQPDNLKPQSSDLSLEETLKQVQDELTELRNKVEEQTGKLKEIKTLLEKQYRAEFSETTIRVTAEDGRPLHGFQVKLKSAAKDERSIVASGQSNNAGLAILHELPYGAYFLSVEGPTGWTAHFDSVTIELGTPFEKTIVAPDPREHALLSLRSSLASSPFKGLRFGEVNEPARGLAGYFVPPSPEPGEMTPPFNTFPQLGDGIEEVGVLLEFRVERNIPQPDGSVEKWQWSPKEINDRFILTPRGVLTVRHFERGSTDPSASAAYFALDRTTAPAEAQDNFRVAYYEADFEGDLMEEVSISVAAGELTVSIADLIAKADRQVNLALGLNEEANAWLRATVMRDSKWIPRILNLDGWTQGDNPFRHLVFSSATLESEYSLLIDVSSPN